MTEEILKKLEENNYALAGEVIPQPKTGLYLYGEFMSGDADHYEESFRCVESWEELEAFLRWFDLLDSMHHNAEISYRTGRNWNEDNFYALVGEEWRKEYLWDALLDWWPYDVTYDSVPAKLEKYWLKYYDGIVWFNVTKK